MCVEDEVDTGCLQMFEVIGEEEDRMYNRRWTVGIYCKMEDLTQGDGR